MKRSSSEFRLNHAKKTTSTITLYNLISEISNTRRLPPIMAVNGANGNVDADLAAQLQQLTVELGDIQNTLRNVVADRDHLTREVAELRQQLAARDQNAQNVQQMDVANNQLPVQPQQIPVQPPQALLANHNPAFTRELLNAQLMTNTRLTQTARQNMYQASMMSTALENIDPAAVPPQLAYLINKNLAVQTVSAIQGRRHGEWMGTALDCQWPDFPSRHSLLSPSSLIALACDPKEEGAVARTRKNDSQTVRP